MVPMVDTPRDADYVTRVMSVTGLGFLFPITDYVTRIMSVTGLYWVWVSYFFLSSLHSEIRFCMTAE